MATSGVRSFQDAGALCGEHLRPVQFMAACTIKVLQTELRSSSAEASTCEHKRGIAAQTTAGTGLQPQHEATSCWLQLGSKRMGKSSANGGFALSGR